MHLQTKLTRYRMCCVLYSVFMGVTSVLLSSGSEDVQNCRSFRHGFKCNLLLPPGGALVYCWLILVFFCWKRLTAPDMGMSASASYGLLVTGRKPPCTFRGGKLIYVFCSKAAYTIVQLHCNKLSLGYNTLLLVFNVLHTCCFSSMIVQTEPVLN